MTRVTDEQLAKLRNCQFLYDNVSISAAAHELTRLRAEVETLKHNHKIECGALADEVHALKAAKAQMESDITEYDDVRNILQIIDAALAGKEPKP